MTNVSEIDNPNFLFHHCKTIPYLHDGLEAKMMNIGNVTLMFI